MPLRQASSFLAEGIVGRQETIEVAPLIRAGSLRLDYNSGIQREPM